MNKTYLLSIISLILSSYCQAQFYIRYNHLGYSPANTTKSIVILSDKNLEGEQWSIAREEQPVQNGTLDSAVSSSLHSPFTYNYNIDFSNLKETGSYSFHFKDSTVSFRIDTNLYNFIPSDILRYFRVQRSGSKECLDHKISHKGDKRCTIHRRQNNKNHEWAYIDSFPKKVDMRGGWYDAGDYIKFTLTTAYSSYLMLKAYEVNPQLFQYRKYSQTTNNDLIDEATWGLDYLMKTYLDTTEFILQVGGHRDHQQGDRMPEYDELNGKRECYSGFSPTQMGYSAGALALGAQVVQSIDSVRANKYKKMAISIYSNARTHSDCMWVKQGWETFYADKTPYDNLMLGAYELYKLTKDNNYLEDILQFSELSKRSYWSSWGNCNPLVQNLQHTEHGKQDLAYFEEIASEQGNIWGVPHKYTWSSLYSFLGVANASSLHKLDSTTANHDMLWQMLDYTLGKNNWGKSFVSSPKILNSSDNIYGQIYKLNPKLNPTGAIAEGPGDRATHEQLKQYFAIPKNYPLEKFNSNGAVFYDLETNFQTMETTIVGLAEGLLFFSLVDLLDK